MLAYAFGQKCIENPFIQTQTQIIQIGVFYQLSSLDGDFLKRYRPIHLIIDDRLHTNSTAEFLHFNFDSERLLILQITRKLARSRSGVLDFVYEFPIKNRRD